MTAPRSAFLHWYRKPSNWTYRETMGFYDALWTSMGLGLDPLPVSLVTYSIVLVYWVWVFVAAVRRFEHERQQNRTAVYDRNTIRWRRW